MIVKPSVSFITADPDAVFNTRVTTIVTSLDGNVNYTILQTMLPPITTANTEFAAALAAAADGGKQQTWAKNQKRDVLEQLVRKLANGVQGACDDDMTKLLSSGFPVQKPDRTKATVPVTPGTPRMSQGLTGQAFAVTSPVAGAYVYNWQVALDSDPDTFVQHLQSTGARTTFDGLTPGKIYCFQCNAVGTAGTSDWSNAGALMVI